MGKSKGKLSHHEKEHQESHERLLDKLEEEYEKTVEEVVEHPVKPSPSKGDRVGRDKRKIHKVPTPADTMV